MAYNMIPKYERIKSNTNDYGFSIELGPEAKIINQWINSSSGYLVISVLNLSEGSTCDIHFKANGDIVDWSVRREELEGAVEYTELENGYSLERSLDIKLQNGVEFYTDTLFFNGNAIDSQQTIARYIDSVPVIELFNKYMQSIEKERKRAELSDEERVDYWVQYLFNHIAKAKILIFSILLIEMKRYWFYLTE